MSADQHPSLDARDHPSIVVPLAAGAGVPAHSHPQHQLTWVPDGVLTMVVGSFRWVVQRSRALWVPGGVPHSVESTSDCAMFTLFFEPSDCPLDLRVPTVVDATGLVGPLLRHLVELPPGANGRRARGNAVLWDLLTPMTVAVIPTILPTDPQARRVALAITDDPADGRALEEWGREVGASSRTLSRRFRAETGVSFESWRTSQRINAALPLLGQGWPVSRVARAVGYGTASAFITAFRREIGTTPAVYFSGAG